MDSSRDLGQATTVGSEEPISASEWKPGLPSHVGRYRIRSVLGEGGFGLVYLAYDEQLERSVAVKVPHRNLVPGPEAALSYLAEARAAAPGENIAQDRRDLLRVAVAQLVNADGRGVVIGAIESCDPGLDLLDDARA